MQELIESGRIVDLILLLVVLEVAALLGWRRLTGRGIAPLPLIANVGAGASIMVALRFALTGADWRLVAGALVASLFFHCTDVWTRWPV